ncbi:MAG: AraC family transcriptional regulator [Rubrivivax sp.]|nr:MAG: AraC family transcriptional regulator [Rubrivivax sp.]
MSVWEFVRDPASLRLLVKFGESKGLSSDLLLARTGLQRQQLDDPNVEIEASQELLVVSNLLQALERAPYLGLEVGQLYSFTTYGIWGYGLISSASASDALALALRFLPLTYAFTLISFEEAQGELVLKFGEPELDDHVKRFLVQRDMAAAARLMSDLVGKDFRLVRLMLSEPQPGGRQGLSKVPDLYGATFEFGCRMNALVVDPVLLAIKMPNANPVTAAMCEQMCVSLMERRRARHGVGMLIRSYLQTAFGNQIPDLSRMAKLLCMSERTLKRRLQEEGTSFRQILLEVRSQLAQDMLAKGTMSMSEIARKLGFTDQSSFSQAYKRWHGMAPSLAPKIK